MPNIEAALDAAWPTVAGMLGAKRFPPDDYNVAPVLLCRPNDTEELCLVPNAAAVLAPNIAEEELNPRPNEEVEVVPPRLNAPVPKGGKLVAGAAEAAASD